MIDDHALVRRGLRALIEDKIPNVLVQEVGTAREGMTMLRDQLPKMVLLDIGLPDRNGLDVMKRIHHEWPRLPVLILSMYSEDEYGLRVIRAGAAGYLTKSSAPEHLIIAVRRVLDGGRYISRRLAEKLAATLSGDSEEEPYQSLSDREYQVFRMIASGKTVSEIGNELNLSVKTISTHRMRILQKTGLRNNADLIHYAITKCLVE
jgi:DNA-binding NarL/FixJ family response regulator